MKPSDLARSSIGLLTVFSAFIIPAWSVYIQRAPDLPAPNQSDPALVVVTQIARDSLTPVSLLAPSIPAPTIRFALIRRADNLDLFLEKQEFGNLPFPDREQFVRRLGSFWCEFHQASGLFLRASVRFRDFSSGGTLASYACANLQTEFHPVD
jgi:hypothetical protein